MTTLPILLLCLAGGAAAATAQASDEARELIHALGCKACHKLAGDGGSLAPELDQIGSRKTRRQIREQLAAHIEARGEKFMPSYRTTSPADLDQISDFLYNLKQ